jgi:hypothetical protein
MIVGQTLAVVTDCDIVIHRILVAFEKGLFPVCRPEEFESAARERREPICIGFRPEYVLTMNSDTLRS